ncbi:MAG: GPR endopeptidase [Clostridia bacterium]|nr:GPR endopeptidase [Clostridia bacterium]
MQFSFRTDLAIETKEAYKKALSVDMPGVTAEDETIDNVKITRVKVETPEGAENIGKPIGNYITLDVPQIKEDEPEINEKIYMVLARELRKLIGENKDKSVLVVGLGNWNVTPDALGPKVISYVEVTRHILEYAPEYVNRPLRSVSAISPGVLGTTGMETGEVIKGVVDKIKPDLVIAIDALASRRLERISTTIQIADTGINPGSGIGNKRMAISQETLGVPVIAIGVPTVVDAATMANDTIELMLENIDKIGSQNGTDYDRIKQMSQEDKYALIKEVLNPYVGDLVVTPKEIDAIITSVSDVVSQGINHALHNDQL